MGYICFSSIEVMYILALAPDNINDIRARRSKFDCKSIGVCFEFDDVTR